MKKFDFNRIENDKDEKENKEIYLNDDETYVHMICAMAFPDIFWLKNIVTMKFYCNNKAALFDAFAAHKTLYGNEGLTERFFRDHNKHCIVCKESKGKLRVTCRRMTHSIKYKETNRGA